MKTNAEVITTTLRMRNKDTAARLEMQLGAQPHISSVLNTYAQNIVSEKTGLPSGPFTEYCIGMFAHMLCYIDSKNRMLPTVSFEVMRDTLLARTEEHLPKFLDIILGKATLAAYASHNAYGLLDWELGMPAGTSLTEQEAVQLIYKLIVIVSLSDIIDKFAKPQT